MIHAHPTLSEAVMEAMRASGGWAIPRVAGCAAGRALLRDLEAHGGLRSGHEAARSGIPGTVAAPGQGEVASGRGRDEIGTRGSRLGLRVDERRSINQAESAKVVVASGTSSPIVANTPNEKSAWFCAARSEPNPMMVVAEHRATAPPVRASASGASPLRSSV